MATALDEALIRRAGERWNIDHKLAVMLTYWEAKRAGRRFPARRDIDPAELGTPILPYLYIVDVLEGATRFRFRLVGTAGVDAAGLELTGQYIDEVNPNKDYARYVAGLYQQAIAVGRPLISECVFVPAGRETPRWTQRVMCPLAADGAAVDMVITAQVYQAQPTDDYRGMLIFVDQFDAIRNEVVPENWREQE